MKFKSKIMDESAFKRTLIRIAHQIIEKNSNVEDVCIVGIKTRGVPIAERIAAAIYDIEGVKVSTGELDITLYRDDLSYAEDEKPNVKSFKLDFDIKGKTVVIADDVIYTGRTVRAALDAILSVDRPSRIQLAVMVDRGHRELPIRPDYVGKNIPTSREEVVKVNLTETDKEDSVEIWGK